MKKSTNFESSLKRLEAIVNEMENSQIDGITMEEELYNNLKNDYSLNYYMKEYLPQY